MSGYLNKKTGNANRINDFQKNNNSNRLIVLNFEQGNVAAGIKAIDQQAKLTNAYSTEQDSQSKYQTFINNFNVQEAPKQVAQAEVIDVESSVSDEKHA